MPPPALVLAAAMAFQAPGGGPFVPKEGGFRIDMPGKPTERSQRMESPFGPIEGRAFAATRGKVSFFVSYSDYPPDIPDFAADKVLERAIAGALGGIRDAMPLGKTDIRLGEVAGKAFEFAYPVGDGGEALCRARFYLDGTRLYSVMLRGPRGDVARVGEPFLRSFALVPREAKGPAPRPAPPRPESPLTTRPGPPPRPVASKPFAPAGGGFRVLMPGKPRERIVVADSPDGPIEAHLFDLVQGDLRRLVTYLDRPKPLDLAGAEADTALEELVKGSILSGKGTLVAKRPIRLGAAVGREFDFDTDGSNGRPRFVRARVYLVGARVYQVLIGGPKSKVVGPIGDAFLDSFTLLNPPTP